ncbi:hypothetical protein QL285_015757 [Trifolium repens]|nr:hypothetical protein QL285_015757 [Trifolium repens]
MIPSQLSQAFPTLNNLVQQFSIPIKQPRDKILWQHSDLGVLSLKDAYSFILHHIQDFHWAKSIWSPDIQPSKSLFVWRLMHNKVPTDENLMLKGCALPFICCFCKKHGESSFHMFFDCEFAIKIWSWFANSINLVLQFTTMDDMWKICDMNWSPPCKVVIEAAMVHLLNGIWFARNQIRFNNKSLSWRTDIDMIIANTSLAENNTKKFSTNSIRDFTILKIFKVSIHHPNAPAIQEVLWQPPLQNWFKCNVDGACV